MPDMPLIPDMPLMPLMPVMLCMSPVAPVAPGRLPDEPVPDPAAGAAAMERVVRGEQVVWRDSVKVLTAGGLDRKW